VFSARNEVGRKKGTVVGDLSSGASGDLLTLDPLILLTFKEVIEVK
jgi:hypothetical protein